MEETLTAKIIHAVVFLAICTAIVVIGWNEPLRYRFMSPEEIAELEHPALPPPPPPTPSWFDTHKTPNQLDPSRSTRGGSSPPQPKTPFTR